MLQPGDVTVVTTATGRVYPLVDNPFVRRVFRTNFARALPKQALLFA